MKVIVCGAGQVGYHIAEYLSQSDCDVTVIDQSETLIREVSEQLDVRGITGYASRPDILADAGAEDTDMIIAVTHIDEVNMIACQVAHSLFKIPKKIARVRHKSYFDPKWAGLLGDQHIPIDAVISPETEVARSIATRIAVAHAFEVIPLCDGDVMAIGVKCTDETPILETPLRQLNDLFPDLNMMIVSIVRNGETIIANSASELQSGDQVYFIAAREHLSRAMATFGYEEEKTQKLLLVGGGNIGVNLAHEIELLNMGVSLKVIELDKERAEQVAVSLQKTDVLLGSGLDQDLLDEAGIKNTETMVALTNVDEVNILACLLGKRYGCKRVIALLNKSAYEPVIDQLGIDSVVNPRAITVSKILEHIRSGKIRKVSSLGEDVGEIIDIEAVESSEIIGKPLRDLDLPSGVIIGAIKHQGKVVNISGDTVIKAGDEVVLFATPEGLKKVAKIFTVRLGLLR